MKRPIKFRGKCTDTGEWVYGSLCISAVHEPNILWCSEDNEVIEDPIIRQDTIEEYTGLKDGNGCEIFENDIVMTYVVFVDEDEIAREFWRVGVISFIAGGFHLTNCINYDSSDMIEKSGIQPSHKSKFSFPAYRSKIIGNIHDNPDLLKGGKNGKGL